MQKIASLALCVLFTALPVYGQSSLNAVDTSLSGAGGMVDALLDLCYVIGAICAVIGAVRGFTTVIDGEESSFIVVRDWFIACISLLVFPALARGLMGY